VEDGEIAAVLIDGEATLKRVYKIPGRLQLRPENPSFSVLEYTGPELEQVRILGKAVYFISPVK
ncbi:XRE family transcriptional regulator, partial [Gemmiger formicilis]|uniref:LexA family protein n=1 Tax=Gemmiger formicilis TaxID=745368 RepID=UPI001D40DA09